MWEVPDSLGGGSMDSVGGGEENTGVITLAIMVRVGTRLGKVELRNIFFLLHPFDYYSFW